MKPHFSIIVDLVTVVILYAYLAFYMVGFFLPASDFVAFHGITMWGVFAAVVCFAYAFVQAGSRSVLRFFTLLIRLLLCLGLALFIDFVVYVCWYRPNDHEWPLGAYILSVIAGRRDHWRGQRDFRGAGTKT